MLDLAISRSESGRGSSSINHPTLVSGSVLAMLLCSGVGPATAHIAGAQLHLTSGPQARTAIRWSRQFPPQHHLFQGSPGVFRSGHAVSVGLQSWRNSCRSFARAAQLDPTCAMCFWGVALTVGAQLQYMPMTAEPRAERWRGMHCSRLRPTRRTPPDRAGTHRGARRHAVQLHAARSIK